MVDGERSIVQQGKQEPSVRGRYWLGNAFSQDTASMTVWISLPFLLSVVKIHPAQVVPQVLVLSWQILFLCQTKIQGATVSRKFGKGFKTAGSQVIPCQDTIVLCIVNYNVRNQVIHLYPVFFRYMK